LGTVIAFVIVGAIVNSFGLRPLLSLDLRPLANSENVFAIAAGFGVVPIIPVLAADFLYYWVHRLQHTVPFLWRFHQVHHATEELNAANSAHHLSEEIFKIPFIVIYWSKSRSPRFRLSPARLQHGPPLFTRTRESRLARSITS